MSHDQRKFPVLRFRESKLHAARIELLRFDHVLVIIAIKWSAFLSQRLQTPNNILYCDRLTIMPAGAGSEREDNPGPILGHFDTLGNEPVFREGLVLRAGHE